MEINENKKTDGIISLDAARKNRKEEPVPKELEYSIHVPEVMDRIAKDIAEFKKELEERAKGRDENNKHDIDKGQFICLLSGISTCRKTPGIPEVPWMTPGSWRRWPHPF